MLIVKLAVQLLVAFVFTFICCCCRLANNDVYSLLTRQNDWNTDEAGCSGADQSETAGPSTTHQIPVHQQHTDAVGRDLCCSRQERIHVVVAVQCSSIESERVVNDAHREPAQTVTALCCLTCNQMTLRYISRPTTLIR